MDKLEEILAGVPQEFKTLEVDAEKKIFKLNGVDFGDGCTDFSISCTGGEGFRIRMELSKRIICANYGFDNALKEPPTVADLEEQVQSRQGGKSIEELKDSVVDRLRKTEGLHQNIKWKLPELPPFLKKS